ncbi:hypothetical protein F4V89_25245 [Neorhizobium galegae]|nr:hypothetical protein F4V89_25245 [Neorhizobium galegae]
MSKEASPSSPSEPNACDILVGVQQRLIASLQEAVDRARRDAVEELGAIGLRHRRPAHDHYMFIALHSLFLAHCGADQETSKGGDPKRAARILHIGGKICRCWQSESGDPMHNDASKKPALSEEDEKDRQDWAEAARNLALKTVVQALVEHASASDPSLRDRATGRIEDFIAGLDLDTEQTIAFSDWARTSLAQLLRPPGRG